MICFNKLFFSYEKILGNNLNLPEYRHKVSITIPSWHYMEVDMLINTGAACFTQISADIKSFRTIDKFQSFQSQLQLVHNFNIFRLRQSFQFTSMFIRDDHQMPIIIREKI